jgi:hypothetical protein
MSRQPFRVHQWTIGQRFRVPLPVGSVLDFAIERDPEEGGQVFCVWVEDKGDDVCSLRWSRASELFATWRRVDVIAHLDRLATAPALRFDAGRVLLTYLVGGPAEEGSACILRWKRTQGGPWSEGATLRERVQEVGPEAAFPKAQVLDEARDAEGRTWQLIRTDRFGEPTYALLPKAAPERAMLRRTPWEDDLLYTGIVASAADRAKLIWDRGHWTLVRRTFDERADGYVLEAIALDLSILRHDANDDGQTDVVDALLTHYDPEQGYTLWAEIDLPSLGQAVGTVIAVRQPQLRSGKVDPTARQVFRSPASLAYVRPTPTRAFAPPMEVIGRGRCAPIKGVRAASSPVPTATPWQQRRPAELTFAIDLLPEHPLAQGWLMPGMVVAEAGAFSLAAAAEAVVEWRAQVAVPAGGVIACLVEVMGYFYSVQLSASAPLQSPHRHRSPSWVGKLYTHRLQVAFSEAAPLTPGLRAPLLHRTDAHQWVVLGVIEVTALC